MKHIVFADFIKKNKVVEIEPNDFGLRIKFENGESIFIGSGYDGLIYTHEKELTGANTQMLFNELNNLWSNSNYVETLQRKYGEDIPIIEILKKNL